MSLVPGLNPNIRLVPQEEKPFPEISTGDVDVKFADDDPAPDENGDIPDYDEKDNIIRINHPDGSITVSLDGNPLGKKQEQESPAGWFDNIASKIDDLELARISDDLSRGIDLDIDSRRQWIEDRAMGIRLLGLKIEDPALGDSVDGAPVEGMSRVRHPLLLEAVLRYQANARSEFLPTDGPVKIRDDSNHGSTDLDELAEAFQKDFNYYLTVTASEYYPDTDRMLLMQGFGGCGFKKIYYCPIRNRPVSDSVDAEDLIVNNTTTDLGNSRRITHRIMMRPSVVKRMQLLGVYRDIDLAQPQAKQIDEVDEAKAAQQGVAPASHNPEENDREIYECCCELDIKRFEHKKKGTKEPSGLEIPYVVTMDKSSKDILAISRNFDKKDYLPVAKKKYVKFPFVPGLGFYDIGLLHILGNTTNALTAAWRELLDAGMFANFPGFLYSEVAGRAKTNVFRIPPGGGAKVDTGGLPISQAIMPLPYKEPSMALMQLTENISEYGQRVGGTAEVAVGEGRADAPVGTTLAMIEQSTKVLSSVHKRFHSAQSEEFQLLVDCFKDHPESFWRKNRTPAHPWDEATFRQALDNYYLVPQADPNTSSSTHRLMKAAALGQMAAASPAQFKLRNVLMYGMRVMGISNPDEFMADMPDQPSAKDMADAAKAKDAADKTKIAQQQADTEDKEVTGNLMLKHMELQKDDTSEYHPEDPNRLKIDEMAAQADLIEAHSRAYEVQNAPRDEAHEDHDRAQERASREHLAHVGIIKDNLNNASELQIEQLKEKAQERDNQFRANDTEKKLKAAAKKAKPKPGLGG